MTNTLFDQLFTKVSESLFFPDCESLCLVVCQSLIIINHLLQSLDNVIIDYGLFLQCTEINKFLDS